MSQSSPWLLRVEGSSGQSLAELHSSHVSNEHFLKNETKSTSQKVKEVTSMKTLIFAPERTCLRLQR